MVPDLPSQVLNHVILLKSIAESLFCFFFFMFLFVYGFVQEPAIYISIHLFHIELYSAQSSVSEHVLCSIVVCMFMFGFSNHMLVSKIHNTVKNVCAGIVLGLLLRRVGISAANTKPY